MIQHGGKLIRISPRNDEHLEFSSDGGRNWNSLFTSSMCGSFRDLSSDGSTIYATTNRGLYFSTSNGHNWNRKS